MEKGLRVREAVGVRRGRMKYWVGLPEVLTGGRGLIG
jgi:hypothetical protein